MRAKAAADLAETLVVLNAKVAARDKDELLWMQSIWTIRGDHDKPYDITRFSYLIEPLESDAPYVAIMSSGGSGKTEAFLGWSMARADRGRRVLYAMENDGKTGLIVGERVNPNLESSTYLRGRCAQTDNIKFKKFPEGFIYFYGMGKDSSVASIHVDDLVLDELDLMDHDLVEKAKKRTISSPDPRVRVISNPWHAGSGIHAEFLAGDQRKWNLVCEKCHVEAPLDWDTHVDLEAATVRCPHCFALMDRLAPGRWIATNSKGKHPSYYMHGLMSPELKLREVCDELRSPDLEKVKAAWQFNKGLPYQSKDGGLTDLDLKRADGGSLAPWTKYAPGGYLFCDPGGLFDVQIYQKKEKGLPFRCTYYGTVRNFTELRSLVREADVHYGLIDYGPEIKGAEEFCETMAKEDRDFRRVAYKKQDTPGVTDFNADAKDPLLVAAQRTGVCDQMVDDVRKRRIVFPSVAVQNPDTRFAKHMKAPQRETVKDSHGNERGVWNEGSAADHQFHVTVQAAIGSRFQFKERRGKGSALRGGSH